MKKYYQSIENGYLVETIPELLRGIVVDLCEFHTLSLRWKKIYLEN